MNKILSNVLLASLAGASSGACAQHEITQKDRAFSQTQLTIKPGDSIVFKNEDEVSHNVFSASSGMEFDIRRQAPGGSSSVPFLKEGVAEIRCSIHPKMKLIVTVKK